MACGIEVSGEASSIEHWILKSMARIGFVGEKRTVGIAVDGPTLAPSPSAGKISILVSVDTRMLAFTCCPRILDQCVS